MTELLINQHIELTYKHSFLITAKKYQVIIGLREPNSLGQTLLKEGYPCKSFHMKAKSSPTGPTAGFITEKACYSKVLPNDYPKHDINILSAKAKGAKTIDLVISESRLRELLIGNLIDLGNEKYSAYYPGGEEKFFINKKGAVFDDNRNPVKVMTNPPQYGEQTTDLRPITADYDLFAIIPRENQSYNQLPLNIPPRPIKENYDIFKNHNLDFLKLKSVFGEGDKNMGNIHFFAKTIIKSLNNCVRDEGYKGGNLVWHGDETSNPFSPGFDINDHPIFFHPNGMILKVKEKSDLNKYYSIFKSQGFAPEYSSRF